MASNIVEAASWNATVQVPDDGDTCSAGSLTNAGVGFQVLADRSQYLRAMVMPSGGYSVAVPLTYPASPTNWTFDNLGPYWETATASEIFDVNIPTTVGASIVSVTATIQPAAGSFAGSGTLATLFLYSLNLSTGVRSQLGTQIDPAAGAGSYDIIHNFTMTLGAPHDYSPTTESLWLAFRKDDAAATTTTLLAINIAVQAA